MNKITDLIRPDLRDFSPYSSARSINIDGSVWLNANELPWDISSNSLNRYPKQQPDKLLEKCADYYGIKRKNLLLTRGSDEAIDLLIRLFCRPEKDSIMHFPPTFGMYEVYAKLQGAKIMSLPLIKASDFSLDENSVLDACNDSVNIIFLCSPNNPTGNVIGQQTIMNLCQALSNRALVVVDEAYIEFSDTRSMTEHLDQFDNLVILRTFSKVFGLAAARMGAMIANEVIIAYMKKILAPYPLPALSVDAALQALASPAFEQLQEKTQIIKQERSRLINDLISIPCVKKIWLSQANFILVECHDASKVLTQLNQQGIVVRDISDKPGLSNMLRITIGTPEENNALIQNLQEIK